MQDHLCDVISWLDDVRLIKMNDAAAVISKRQQVVVSQDLVVWVVINRPLVPDVLNPAPFHTPKTFRKEVTLPCDIVAEKDVEEVVDGLKEVLGCFLSLEDAHVIIFCFFAESVEEPPAQLLERCLNLVPSKRSDD
jgi:hypothetical protein